MRSPGTGKPVFCTVSGESAMDIRPPRSGGRRAAEGVGPYDGTTVSRYSPKIGVWVRFPCRADEGIGPYDANRRFRHLPDVGAWLTCPRRADEGIGPYDGTDVSGIRRRHTYQIPDSAPRAFRRF